MSLPGRFALAVPLLLLSFALHPAPRQQPVHSTDVNAIRALAVRVKNAYESAKAGRDVAHGVLDSFAFDVARLAARTNDPVLDQKIRAIGAQLGEMQVLVSGSRQQGTASAVSHANVDIEIVSPNHGGSCRSALGITPGLPVRLTLAAAGSRSSEAWFRVDTRGGEFAGFKTDSNGADPAIALFPDCDDVVRPVAENDDAFGLDASAATRSGGTGAIYARVTNTGNGGTVVVDAMTTLTTISGQIIDAATNAPIQNAYVTVHGGSLFYGGLLVYGSAYTNASGSYLVLLSSVQASLSTYVRVDASQHVAMIYPSAACAFGSGSYSLASCTAGQASLVNVTAGSAVTGIDMALSSGLKISGTVSDLANNLIGSWMEIADVNGTVLDYGPTDENGAYSFTTVTPGTYKLLTQSNGFGYQLYDHVDCSGPLMQQCDFADGTSLGIVDQNVANIDFQLTPLSSISISIMDDTNQPIAGAPYVMNSYGTVVAQGTATNTAGSYTAGPLPAGTFYVATRADGYFPQIYAGIDCPAECAALIGSATPIVISGPQQTKNTTFALHPLPTVHGHVQDALTSAPLANVTVVATQFAPVGTYTTITNPSGDYSLDDVNPGTYYVVAESEDHIDEIYPSIACEFPPSDCNLAGAGLLTIALGQIPPAFDFSLNPSSRLSGHANLRTSLPADLPAVVSIEIVDSGNNYIGSATTDIGGNYVINDLVPGTYYADATDYFPGRYTPQIWQSLDCASICLPVTGTPIVVGSNSEVTGVNFTLLRHDVIVGRITDSDGNAVPGAKVDLFLASNGTYVASGTADSDGYYAAPGYVGDGFLLATDAGAGYINQVHDGIICAYPTSAHAESCSLQGATTIGLTAESTQSPIVNFVLSSSDPLFKNGFE